MRIGSGFDVHAFGEGDHLMLGGVRLPFDRGMTAHCKSNFCYPGSNCFLSNIFPNFSSSNNITGIF